MKILFISMAIFLVWNQLSVSYAQELTDDGVNWVAFEKEFELLSQGECHTKLYFRKLIGTWYIKVEGEGSMLSLQFIYPKNYNSIKRMLELIGAGDDVSMYLLMRSFGQC